MGKRGTGNRSERTQADPFPLTLFPFLPLPVAFFPFSFHPNLAVFKEFLLPNRHRAFQLTNGPLAGCKCCPPMRSADRDYNAGLANFQPARPVHDPDVANDPRGDRAALDVRGTEAHRDVAIHFGNAFFEPPRSERVASVAGLNSILSTSIQRSGAFRCRSPTRPGRLR